MTVWHTHGYKLVAFIKDDEPWIRSVETDCPGPECMGCKDRKMTEDLRRTNVRLV